MAKGKSSIMQKIGSWAFIIGVIIAIIAGFWPLSQVVTAILVVLGLFVGFLNVTGKESNNFLMAAAVLVIVATFGGSVLGSVTDVLQQMLNAIIVFVVPAAIVVSLKAIYSLASD
ncbi:MAG: hypothetical protein V1725_06020 [archaeon]